MKSKIGTGSLLLLSLTLHIGREAFLTLSISVFKRVADNYCSEEKSKVVAPGQHEASRGCCYETFLLSTYSANHRQ